MLVAEVEPMVRAMAVRALEQAGYTVLAVESGEAALQLFEAQSERVRLVLTDVAMAGVDGLELGRRLAEIRRPSRALHERPPGG